MEYALSNDGHDQVPLPAGLRQESIPCPVGACHQRRFHMTVRQGLVGLEQGMRINQQLIAQQTAQRIDLGFRPVRQVG
jgi:hypothetical protein